MCSVPRRILCRLEWEEGGEEGRGGEGRGGEREGEREWRGEGGRGRGRETEVTVVMDPFLAL